MSSDLHMYTDKINKKWIHACPFWKRKEWIWKKSGCGWGGTGRRGGKGNCVWDVIHSVSWDTLALFPTKQQILSVSLNSFIKGQ